MRWTKAKEWKKPAPRIQQMVLPSGNEVVLNKPDLVGLVANNAGLIPDQLTPQVADQIEGKPMPTKISLKDWPRLGEFIDMVCKTCFVHPVIVDNPDYDKDELSLADIEPEDKLFVFKWALPGEVQLLSQFPQKQGANVGAASEMPELRDNASNGDGD